MNKTKDIYEFKIGHGWFIGTCRQTDVISIIDACIAFQHILLIEVEDEQDREING